MIRDVYFGSRIPDPDFFPSWIPDPGGQKSNGSQIPDSRLRNTVADTLCSPQTRTGIGLLGKPPAVKQFPPTKANRWTRLLRDPRANAGMKRTSVVEHNFYFARARDRGIHKRSKPKGLRQN